MMACGTCGGTVSVDWWQQHEQWHDALSTIVLTLRAKGVM